LRSSPLACFGVSPALVVFLTRFLISWSWLAVVWSYVGVTASDAALKAAALHLNLNRWAARFSSCWKGSLTAVSAKNRTLKTEGCGTRGKTDPRRTGQAARVRGKRVAEIDFVLAAA
jgi:hypothetical protein